MALVSHTLKGMYNGVSQQPAPLRLDNQLSRQINFNSDVVKGVSKRPSTKHLASLASSEVSLEASIHTINTSVEDKYKVIFTGDSVAPIEIFDFNGTSIPVTYDKPSCKDYVTTLDPQEDIRAVSLPEKTFILNRSVVVEEGYNPITTPTGFNYFPKHSFVYVKYGIAEQDYTLKLFDKDGALIAEHTVTAPEPSIDSINPAKTSEIAEQLVTGLTPSLPAGYHLVATSSMIDFWYDGTDLPWSANDLHLKVTDSYGDTAMISINGSVVDFGNLPNVGIDYYPIAVTGEANESEGALYVEWDSNKEIWRETRAFYDTETGERIPELIVSSTMPHVLEKQTDGSFLLREENWGENGVGDEHSSPMPSFVGKTLNNLFFHRNRLGFLLKNGLFFSVNSEYNNLFPESASSVLSTDPIDVDLTTKYKVNLQYAIPLQRMLLLFADEAQGSLSTNGNPLTVQTINFTLNTYYEVDSNCEPIGSGGSIFFASPNGNHSSIRDYYVDRNSMTFESSSTTSHVPSYIPKDIRKFAKRANEDTLFVVSSEEPNRIYVHNFAWGSEGKLQNAWSFWQVEEDLQILDIDVTGAELYLITKRLSTGETFLMSMDLTGTPTGSLPMSIHLDQLMLVQGTFNQQTRNTEFVLPYNSSLSNLTAVNSQTGLSLETPEVKDVNTVFVAGDYTDVPYFIGQSFEALLEYNKFYLQGSSGISSITTKVQLKTLYVTFTDTGEFKLRITPYNRDYLRDKIDIEARGLESYLTEGIKEQDFSGVTLGESIIDSPPILSGQTRFQINASHDTTKLEIISDSYLPASFQLTAFEAEVNARAKEV